jgi:ribokinase
LPGHGITTDDQNPTGIALILVDDVGQNAISVAPGANALLSGPDVLSRFGAGLRGGKYLLMQLECRAELAVDLASWARNVGCVSILNPAPPRPLPPDALASFDIITPNEGELATLAASLGLAAGPADVLARQLVSCGVRDVLVTLGNAAPCGPRPRGWSISMLIRSGPSTRPERATPSTPAWPRPWSAVSRWRRRSITAAGRERSV